MNISLINKIQYILTKKFVRNVAIVATGTAGAQAIGIAFSPIITRLYGPDAFGILGSFMAIVVIVTQISALSYPIAIVLPKHDDEAKGIVRLSINIAIAFSVFLTLILLIWKESLIEILNIQDISTFIFLIPVAMLFAAFVQIAQHWLIRKKQFGITARMEILKSLTVNTSKAGLGFFYPIAGILIILFSFGYVIHAVLLGLGIKNSNSIGEPKLFIKKNDSNLLNIAKKYYDFPVYRAPQLFINAVSQGIPILMLAGLFGPASAGFYAICKNVLQVPTLLIGKSVSNVFYPRVAEAKHTGEKITPLIVKATWAMAIVGIIPYVFVVFLGTMIFEIAFGNQWTTAGEYARWLAIWYFTVFFSRPCVSAIPVLNLQPFFLKFEIIGTVLRVGAIYIGYYFFNNDIYVVAIFSITSMLIYLVLLIKTIYVARIHDRNQ